MDQGKGLWSGSLVVPFPRIGPEEWVQTREGEILLDKTDLLMEDAENYEDLRLRATLDRRAMAGSFKWLLCVPMLAAGGFSEAFKNAVQDARRSRA